MPKEAKQILVVRKDLQMRKGKIAAQCAHASTKVLLDYSSKDHSEFITPNVASFTILCAQGTALYSWLHESFAKICVYVTSEEELLALEQKARAAGIMSAMITDAGRTEFHGVPTKTVLAIGPAWVDEINPITGHLPLL